MPAPNTAYAFVAVRVLGPLIDAASFAKRKAEAWGTPKSTYASVLNHCLRQLWYSRMGYPERNTGQKAEWLRNAQTGTDMHEAYQELCVLADAVASTDEVLAHAGLVLDDYPVWAQRKGLPKLAIELPTPKNDLTEIGGRMDVVVKLHGTYEFWEGDEAEPKPFTFKDPTYVVVDIKTVKREYFRNLPGSHKWADYYSQLQLYMHFYRLEWALVFAVNRDDDSCKEYLIRRDDAYIAGRLERAIKLKGHLTDKTVPAAEPDFMGCRLCPFQDLCDREEMKAT